jgi:hypothetical protein
MKDEGFLSPAGTRFVIIAAVILLAGVLAYFAFSEDVSLDFLDDLGTDTSTTSTTDFDVDDLTVPDVTVPDLDQDPYFRCLDRADTAQEIIDCANRQS